MKTRVIILTASIILILACTSSAYAEDNPKNDVATNSHNITTSGLIKNSTLPDPKNNRTNISYTSIQDAINSAQSGDTILIEQGTYKENGLIIDKNLNLIGSGKTNTIIDAESKNYVFWIKSGVTVTIANLNITNGKASIDTPFDRNGGGIYNEGTLTLNNCTFYKNNATGASSSSPSAGSGGAIYNNGTLTITNCDFISSQAGKGEDASATHYSSKGGSGGAIYNIGTIKNIQNCTFTNNTAGNGGESSATNNAADGGNGGAISNYGTINNIQGCTFTNNHAGNGGSDQSGAGESPGVGGLGGAIYNNKIMNITNSTFNSNYAGNGGKGTDIKDGADGGDGGAIYNTGTITITNSEIFNNKFGNGGTASGDKHSGNDGNGGGIYNIATLTINNSKIHDNSDGSECGMLTNGGGIYNSGSLTMHNSAITNNFATDGGGIYNSGNSTIYNSTITNNTYSGIYNSGILTIYNSTITNNTAGEGYGGGVYNGGGFSLFNSTISHNTAQIGGGVYNTDIMLSSNSQCVNNSPDNINGSGKLNSNFVLNNRTNSIYSKIQDAINYASAGDTLIIEPGTYNENELTIDKNLNLIGSGMTNTIINAGANNLIFWIKPGVTVTIANLNITNGTASSSTFDRNGGGIYNEGTLTITNCTFYKNNAKGASSASGTDDASAAGNGGAIYNTGTLTITNCDFNSNTAGKGGDASASHYSSAGGSGGAICNTGTIKNIQNCTFTNNTAGNGGESSSFHDAANGGDGGAISNYGTINNIQGCTFTGNYAGNGGSVQTKTAANGGTGGNGGAIYSNNTVTITNSTFNGNYAGDGGDGSDLKGGADGGDGGAIWSTGTFSITNCEIQNNAAGNGGDDEAEYGENYGGDGGDGGAIWNAGKFSITNCEIQHNTAGNGGVCLVPYYNGNDGNGGGVYNNGNLTIINSKILDNIAGNSGGIYGNGGGICNNANLTINNSNIQNNIAGNGGGIYNSGNTSLNNNSITHNTANFRVTYDSNGHVSGIYSGEGGAVFNNGQLTLTNDIFANNTAMFGGALYYTGNGLYNVTNCSFENNTVTAVDSNGYPIQVVTYNNTPGGFVFISATIEFLSGTGEILTKIDPIEGIDDILNSLDDIFKKLSPSENTVQATGGAIYMLNNSNLNITNCNFKGNTASVGGGIANFGSGTLTITHSTFINNAAGIGGAVYCNDLGPLTVTDCIFRGNAAFTGGAISYSGNVSGEWGNLNVTHNIFYQNDASLGGAIYDNYEGYSKINFNYNQIYGVNDYDIYYDYDDGKANAQYNWWGSNTGPGVYETNNCNVVTIPYMVVTLTPSNNTIYYGENSTITVDILHDNTGVLHYPQYGVIPDGIQVTFNTTLNKGIGSITPLSLTLINGTANATYIANGTIGSVVIYGIVGNNSQYPANTTINVLKIPTSVYLNPTHNFAGQNVTLIAKVTDNNNNLINGGNVTFYVGIAPAVTAPVVNGYAWYYWTIPLDWSPENYPVIANYTGTNIYASSSITEDALTVDSLTAGSTGITVNPPITGYNGENVNLTATLINSNHQPLSGKNITFIVNNVNVGSAVTDINGLATLPYNITSKTGVYMILAQFTGDSQYAGSSNTGILNVITAADKQLDLLGSSSTHKIGETFTLKFKLSNKGPDTAKDVVVKIPIPEGFKFISANVDQGTWNYDKSTRTLIWNVGDVEVGDPYLYLNLKAVKKGKYTINPLMISSTYDPYDMLIPLNIEIKDPEDNQGNKTNNTVKAASKTISLQKTGLPIAGLILAVLMVLGGLGRRRR